VPRLYAPSAVSALPEYTSGAQVVVNHPEAVRAEARFHVARSPDGNYVLFAPEGVSRLLDSPAPQGAKTV
jgi:hypothetical protein